MAEGILGRILEVKRGEVAQARRRVPPGELAARARLAPRPRDFIGAVRRPPGGVPRVIAEVKRASPSAGLIRPEADPVAIAREYEQAGAAAVSVLTDERFFAGSLADLAGVRERIGLPVLRKDFIVDEYQVMEARAAGADAVLLIVAALDDGRLAELISAATGLEMTALVEVHDEAEAERAARLGARLVGVNHRNLATMQIDMTLFGRLRPLLPEGCLAVAESGIREAADVRALAAAGADAILVGETLMRRPSPGAALRELLG